MPLDEQRIAAAFGIAPDEWQLFAEYLEASGYNAAQIEAEEARVAYIAWAKAKMRSIQEEL